MLKSTIGFGATLTNLRRHTRWSQAEVADKFRVSQATIARWEASSPTAILRINMRHLAALERLCRQVGMAYSCRVIN